MHEEYLSGCFVSLLSDLYYELSYYTYLGKIGFIHRHVDTYARHASVEQAINTAFALVGLFLVNRRGFTGKQVNSHMILARKPSMPSFSVPKKKLVDVQM